MVRRGTQVLSRHPASPDPPPAASAAPQAAECVHQGLLWQPFPHTFGLPRLCRVASLRSGLMAFSIAARSGNLRQPRDG
jgi:hypothetical protein